MWYISTDIIAFPFFYSFTLLNICKGAIIIKKVIDKEYQTSYSLEVAWLSENNIRYTYVKVQDGITVWKYKKTKQLFDALSEFYKNRID